MEEGNLQNHKEFFLLQLGHALAKGFLWMFILYWLLTFTLFAWDPSEADLGNGWILVVISIGCSLALNIYLLNKYNFAKTKFDIKSLSVMLIIAIGYLMNAQF